MRACNGRGAPSDRGSVELAVATPLLLLLVLLVLQAGIWAHGDHVAASVAHRAVESARAAGGDAGSAEAEAAADRLGGDLLRDRTVDVQRGQRTVRVAVEAEVPTLIPGVSWPVRHELTAPTERYVDPESSGDPP